MTEISTDSTSGDSNNRTLFTTLLIYILVEVYTKAEAKTMTCVRVFGGDLRVTNHPGLPITERDAGGSILKPGLLS